MFFRKKLANAIRFLSIDSIQRANSGHPGAPMGMADIAEVLWRKFLKHNPKNPNWFNRDRFILSNGHASMLLYSVLHLSGYSITIEDLKNFRQCHSKTPGHPEVYCTPGVEITTGPLGQGLAAGVGMAIAERTLSAYFNRINFPIIDHNTWIFSGDGCLMEGISHEACSLAGTLGLGKLIVFYDKNGISIDGHVSGWYTDNVAKRFQAYNWQVLEVDGHNILEITQSIQEAKLNITQPTLIICKTIIGFGSPNKSNTAHVHGAPLGEEEILLTRKKLEWEYLPFLIPQEIYHAWDAREQGKILEDNWNLLFKKYTIKYPKLSKEFLRRINGILPSILKNVFQDYLLKIRKNPKNISTREASKNVIETFSHFLPELLGGSADLAPSNLTLWSGSKSIKDNHAGNYIHYGVREFGMTSIANGIYHHGGFLPYTATFLVFMDYARNAVRMSALMKTKQIFIYTHDSIGLGEDGPTHQPVEQIATLRLLPNMSVWRPCDSIETIIAWYYALNRKNKPTSLILSRQNMPQFHRNSKTVKNIFKGGYILQEFGKKINLIILATGSEVELAIQVAEKIYSQNYGGVRVISMVSADVFDKQEKEYRNFILPKSIRNRVSIEAGSSEYWRKYIGIDGLCLGMNSFGESGPNEQVFSLFGFTKKNIIEKIKNKFFS